MDESFWLPIGRKWADLDAGRARVRSSVCTLTAVCIFSFFVCLPRHVILTFQHAHFSAVVFVAGLKHSPH
jgi:hypothetical protein